MSREAPAAAVQGDAGMLEQTGIVTDTDATSLWVETRAVSGCSSCSSGSCGTAAVSKLLGGKRTRLQLPNSLAARPGDTVVIGIPEGVLVRSALSAYLLPLLLMIGAALSGQLLGGGEMLQGLLALAGLAVGFMLVRRLSGNRADDRFGMQPRLLRLAARAPVPVVLPAARFPGPHAGRDNGLPD